MERPPDDDPSAYPPVAVTVDVVVLGLRAGLLSVLLIRRAEPPFAGWWALPGGFVRPGEGLDDAAERELAEETSVVAPRAHLEQLASYGAPDRDPRMRVVSVAYLAVAPELPAVAAGGDAEAARWWPVDDIVVGEGLGSEDTRDDAGDRPALAFDHERILLDGVERLRAKLEYAPLAPAFLDEPFTLGELRRVYEAVWGVPLHDANFRRKVLSTPGLVVEVGGLARPGSGGGRPARLYRRGDAALLHPALLRPVREEPVRGR